MEFVSKLRITVCLWLCAFSTTLKGLASLGTSQTRKPLAVIVAPTVKKY